MNGSLIIAQASGYIKQFDPVHFSGQPTVQLLIGCEDGYFTAPYAIDIPLGTLNTLTPIINCEEGTAPTGLDLQFTVTANHSNFLISGYTSGWRTGSGGIANQFLVTYPFLVGDVVTISTQMDARRITLLRSSVEYDLAGYINAGAPWPKLYSGVNVFTWTFASAWMTWNKANYTPRYWGV